MSDITTEEKDARNKNRLGIGCLTVFMLFLIAVVWAVTSDDYKKPDGVEAFVASQNFVTERLKAPSTAKFPTYDKSMVATNDNKRFKVTSYVDAQNSFGASVRTRYVCIITHVNGNQWQLDHIQLLD